MNIRGLMFNQTCGFGPEQYDVINGRGRLVGYVRLRWGHLTCDYPNVGGEEIYKATIGDGIWTGCFTSEEERMYHLDIIADKIRKRMKQERIKRQISKGEICQRKLLILK